MKKAEYIRESEAFEFLAACRGPSRVLLGQINGVLFKARFPEAYPDYAYNHSAVSVDLFFLYTKVIDTLAAYREKRWQLLSLFPVPVPGNAFVNVDKGREMFTSLPDGERKNFLILFDVFLCKSEHASQGVVDLEWFYKTVELAVHSDEQLISIVNNVPDNFDGKEECAWESDTYWESVKKRRAKAGDGNAGTS